MTAPLYPHTCPNCTFLGNFQGEGDTKPVDLYHCLQSGLPTVIARFGLDEPEYTSGLNSPLPSLQEAQRRALARGLFVGLVTHGTKSGRLQTSKPNLAATPIPGVNYDEDPRDVVKRLNDEITDMLENNDTGMTFHDTVVLVTGGYEETIQFMGNPIWGSEDDPRDWDESESYRVPPLSVYCRLAIEEHLRVLSLIAFPTPQPEIMAEVEAAAAREDALREKQRIEYEAQKNEKLSSE